MTAVEFFDRSPIANVVSSLTTQPEKIIFLGTDRQMERFDPIYRCFLKERGLNIPLEYRTIPADDLQGIVQVLTSIADSEPDCVFDLTGGKDLALVAMGMVWERRRGQGLQLQRFRMVDSSVTDCDGDGHPVYQGHPTLTVEQSILLHGGKVRKDNAGDGRTYGWELTPEFIRDVHSAWAICRKDPKGWNARLNVLSSAIVGKKNSSSLAATVSLSKLQARARQVHESILDIGKLLHDLHNAGLILDYREGREEISFRYKDAQVKQCLEKAGTTLEMEVLVTARELRNEDGTDCYHDAMCGVSIDWDGRFHSWNDDTKDTENEIDVLLMKGLMPVYISCKNGQVEDVELYKLDTVARRFGGPVARKALITSRLDMKKSSRAHYRQRAKDMGIKLVENACDLEPEEFREMVRQLIHL